MKINIQNPQRLVEFVERSVTSWSMEYIGCGIPNGIYYYTLKNRRRRGIKVNVELHSETQEMYDPMSGPEREWVKIYCKDVNVPLKRGCTKFLRVEHFKDIRRVFNTIHDGAIQVLQ